MKALHPLTEEQRIFAEKHHDFIYQYLNGRHLNIEDYYDTAVFGYLKAVQDYLEKPELQQYRFHRPHRHAGCTGNGMEKTEPAHAPGLSGGVSGRYR